MKRKKEKNVATFFWSLWQFLTAILYTFASFSTKMLLFLWFQFNLEQVFDSSLTMTKNMHSILKLTTNLFCGNYWRILSFSAESYRSWQLLVECSFSPSMGCEDWRSSVLHRGAMLSSAENSLIRPHRYGKGILVQQTAENNMKIMEHNSKYGKRLV